MSDLNKKQQSIYDDLISGINVFTCMPSQAEHLISRLDDLIDTFFEHCLIVEKIWAVGSYKSFMWVRFGDVRTLVPISRSVYYHLKASGVPTSQSLRKKNNV